MFYNLLANGTTLSYPRTPLGIQDPHKGTLSSHLGLGRIYPCRGYCRSNLERLRCFSSPSICCGCNIDYTYRSRRHLQKSHFHIWIYMHAPGTKDGHRFGVQGMTIYVHMTIVKNFIWSKDMHQEKSIWLFSAY